MNLKYEKESSPPIEELTISTRESYETTSIVFIRDRNRDGICDFVRVMDRANNTGATVERLMFGRFKINGIDREGGLTMFELFSDHYSRFLEEHGIRQRVDDYTRRIEVNIFRPGS